MSCLCPACEYGDQLALIYASTYEESYRSSCHFCPIWREPDKETCMEFNRNIDTPGLFEIWENAENDETWYQAALSIYTLAEYMPEEELPLKEV